MASHGPFVKRAIIALQREARETVPLIRITRQDVERMQDLIYSPITKFRSTSMSGDLTRQHYQMATGKGLQDAPSKSPSPGMKKGGKMPPKSMPKKGKK